jgi:NAD(P)-dependent dehydrogenase (short-subunit alcohol dehydrogenase family)
MKDFSGKTAVVTGGGSGIGLALAKGLAAAGAKVVIADIVAENAERGLEEVRTAGGEAIAVVCDVSERTAVAELKALANAAFGRVGLLFANAGATATERLTEMSDEEVDWVLEANLKGVMNSLRSFLPDMYEAREGHVLATSSGAGLQPTLTHLMTVYAAAKAGIIGLMLALRKEAAEFGVGATVLCPGAVQTAMATQNSRYRPARFGGPSATALDLPDTSARLLPAADAAAMVLEAVRENRPMVVTDSRFREPYLANEHTIALAAFDAAAAYEARTR